MTPFKSAVSALCAVFLLAAFVALPAIHQLQPVDPLGQPALVSVDLALAPAPIVIGNLAVAARQSCQREADQAESQVSMVSMITQPNIERLNRPEGANVCGVIDPADARYRARDWVHLQG